MVDIDSLERGEIVQLVSGGPFMTVRGFKPIGGPPGTKQPSRSQVSIILWNQRLGFIERDFAAHELRLAHTRPLRSWDAGAGGIESGETE